jgi:PAS domain S-box-containing protein
MTEGVSLAAEDGTILYTNPAEDRMFGYASGELVGQHVSVQNGYPPEENARIVGEVIEELKRSGAWRGEWLNRRKDGSTFITTSRISAVRIEGQPHWLCVQEDITEQNEAAAELRASEARLELATDAAALGIWDWDVSTGRMTYSPLARAICGFPPDEEVTYDDARRVTHPDDFPRTSAMARRALDPTIRERQPYEYRILRPDGSVRWVLANGEAVFEQVDGEIRATRYVGTIQDITDRRRLEEERSASEARLRLAIEAGSMAVWEVDLETDQIIGSHELNRVLGFPEDANPTAHEVRARYYPGERERIRAIAQATLARGERTMEAEYRYMWPDGSIRWLMLRAEVVTDASEQPVRAVGVVMDITERKGAEAALRASNERFRCAVEAVDGVLWTNDATGRMVGEQPGWAALTGQSPEEYEGFGWAQAVHPEDAETTVVAWNEAVAERKMFVHEHRVRRQDGKWRLFSIRAVPVIAADGSIWEWVGVHTDITEQREAEASVRASEERLRAVVEAAPVGLVFADASGRITGGNAQVERILGHPIIPSESVDEYREWVGYHPDGRRVESHEYPLARVLAGEELPELEVLYERGDGRKAWINFIAAARRDSEGRITGGVVASLDIDDRRRAEEELQRLNEDLERQVLERSRERGLIWQYSLDLLSVVDMATGSFDAVNPAWTAALGWDADTLVGRCYADFLHSDDVRASSAAFEQVRAGKPVLSFENRYRTKDGDWRWLSWVAVPEGGKLYSVTRDVTAEKEQQAKLEVAEAARRELDALYRAYFENTPEALFLIKVEGDADFLVEQINPAHEAGIGLKLEEVRGKRIQDILPADVAKQILATYRHVVASGAIYQYREEYDLGGDPQHWDTSLVPMRGPDGKVTRLIGSSRNVTRQVMAEEALRQSQKMEAMGQLTGGVAHDFNNLLTPIVGSLDMLQRKGLGSPREQRLIAGAAQSAERAKTLVQRLLAFARRQPLQAVPVDIAKLIDGMGELVASTTGPQIKVVVDAPSNLPLANADPNQLEMAILNLAVNARDAMSEGGTLRISASAESVGPSRSSKLKAGEYIRVSVADTGTGMDEATLARAVEPFFSTKGIGKGTGLGLSMVHGLASQLGGALTIESRLGLGTNVELWLPRSSALPATDLVPGTAGTMAGCGTALLVDDEELVRMSTADMLNEFGYRVIEAASAEEAMDLVRSGVQFDLLVTDHLMPGMNGAELALAIRSVAPTMPVLLVSGYADHEGIDPALPRLSKPFRRDELASSLSELTLSAE